jgi:hypothetical protein
MPGAAGPRDGYHLIFASFVMCGAAFLFPYNSIITPVDFFKERCA